MINPFTPDLGCPSRDDLADFALGKEPSRGFGNLEDHVATCVTCQAALETLDNQEDSVVSDLHGAAWPDVPPRTAMDTRLREVMERAFGEPNGSSARACSLSEDQPPRRFGQYEIIERIGGGGMGTVFKARHTRLNRFVALKVLPAHMLQNPQACARFEREMATLGQLEHPHVVRAYDAGEVDGRHYLAMELLDGVDLARLVRSAGPLNVPDACEVVRQAALGLQFAHQSGFVHRDVKPSNLMLLANGHVKLLDLGLTQLRRLADGALKGDRVTEATPAGDPQRTTNTDQVLGTGDFLAPEQARDARSADARADIYSLGCTLYYLLTGSPPFDGPSCSTLSEKVGAHLEEPFPSVRASRQDVPVGLAAVLERMAAKDPAKRFAEAADVGTALEPYTAGSDLGRLMGQEAATKSGPLRKPRWRRAGLWCLTCLLAAAILLPLAFRQLVRRPGEDESRGPRTLVNSLGMEMVEIPAGNFVMGSTRDDDPESWDDERPPHKVTISKSFFIGRFEVTVGQFQQFVEATGYETDAKRSGLGGWKPGRHDGKFTSLGERRPEYTWKHPAFAPDLNHPVAMVSWNDATAFGKWLSEKEGRPYRLPTEAEWEYAARAGTTMPRHSGKNPVSDFGWWFSHSGLHTHPVGILAPNANGLYDMYGNVSEWCLDWYSSDYYSRSPPVDPPGPDRGDNRITRGGGYSHNHDFMRSAHRGKFLPDQQIANIGFRIVCEISMPDSRK